MPITPEEKLFVRSLQELRNQFGEPNLSGAFKVAFPEQCAGKTDQQIKRWADSLSKKAHIRRLIEQDKLSSTDLASGIIRDTMQFGTEKAQLDAAKTQFNIEGQQQEADGVKRWIQIGKEVGAEVVIPACKDGRTMSFADFVDGKAFFRLPFRGETEVSPVSRSPMELYEPRRSTKRPSDDVAEQRGALRLG